MQRQRCVASRSERALIGPAALDTRFPGQWFQIESGLHYNWHRHYDPTTGRYTQPDPLGFVDGPGVFAYAGNTPYGITDPDGQRWWYDAGKGLGYAIGGLTIRYCLKNPHKCKHLAKAWNYCKKFLADERGGKRDLKQVRDAINEALRKRGQSLSNDAKKELQDKLHQDLGDELSDVSYDELIDMVNDILD